MKHLEISITGRVQGVFFRDSARQEANRLGIAGFARNEPDGSVYIEAEGEKEALDAFVKWCRRGPPWAQVDTVRVKDGEAAGHSQFQIRF